jgi:uncharacterized RDD family membrane protein YckC
MTMLLDDTIYYGIEGERYGPVDRETLISLIERGHLRAQDFLWDESREEWVALADIPALATHLVVGQQSLPVAARLPFAGFGPRLAAHLCDALFLLPPALAWSALVASYVGIDPSLLDIDALRADPWSAANRSTTIELLKANAWFYGGLTLIEWLYRAGLESSPFRGTLGKRLFGLTVVDARGERIGFGRATARHFAKLLSWLPLGLGFLAILLQQKRQGLHDQLAGTFVLRG